MIVGEEPDREEDALHVFLLMGKEYRISRSIRAQWFFQQLSDNSTLPYPKPHDELIESNEELEVLSVIPKNRENPGPYRLVPSTHITFIGRRYRFVFCLDISPSLATVDIQSGTVITDEAFEKLKNCLCGLVAPFSVPGNSIVLSPELYITVLAYTSILNPEAPQVLVQGCLVTEQNVNTVLELVHDQLKGLEDFLAKTTATLQCCDTSSETNKAESEQGGVRGDSVKLMSPEAGPISILRNTLLALQLLPCNASAGAVVITDGVFALPDASAVDSILAQLRASTVCCSFIKVGSGFHAHCSLGYVPHCDMMQFIAMASSGAYLAKAPPVLREATGVDGDDFTMNLYHKALLCWNFQRDFDLSKIDSWIGDCLELSEEDLAWALKGKRSISYALSEWEQNAMQPSMRKRHLETKLHTSITSVLSVRLREGYSIQDVSITKGGKQLQVRLTIPWKHNVQIEYLALSAWPLSPTSPTNCLTHVEVTIEAPYEFLHDVTYPTKQPFTSGYRTLVVRRFRQTIKSLQSTDEMLVHLQSFSSNSSYYTIPESAKNGVPLFYLPPNSNNPVLSLQHARKSSKSQESQFAVFWKPVLSLDTSVWQRWMHCHRIGLVLEHDVPLPKNLHLPMENDRSSAIQCRVALSSLNSLCRNWSSFVLLENHSYIKFISSKNTEDAPSSGNKNLEDAPSSFCITRITVRGPCIVIRVAFLGGTPGYIRHEIVSDLTSKLSEVKAPLAANVKPSKAQVKGKNLQRVAQMSTQRAVIEKPCTIMYDKPLEKILVRYERIPEHLFTPFPEQPHYSVYPSLTGMYAHRTHENHMKVLCQYLHHHRWIWTMQDEGSPAMTAEDVGRVLSTLTKLRLQEGYNFVNNSAGIITMAKELTMKDHTKDHDQFYSCIIQYVLFPPYHQPTEEEESIADWAIEGKPTLGRTRRKFNMVTEVWAEPQFGTLTNLNSELKYLEGLQYNEVPQAIFQVDVKHVSALLTYDHLKAMSDDQTMTTPQRIVNAPKVESDLIHSNWVVEQVPFPFDVIGLLPKTRQVEMVFSSLIEPLPQVDNSDLPNENLFKLLLENMERLNDREVTLTEIEWQRFTQHVQSRKRNGIPLPFPEELYPVEQGGKSILQSSKDKKPRNKNASSIKWRCFMRHVTALGRGRIILTFLPASFKYARLMGKQGRSRSSSTGSSPKSPHHAAEKEPEGTKQESSSPGDKETGVQRQSSLLTQGSVEDSSSTPTPTVERDESTFAFTGQTENLPLVNRQTGTEFSEVKAKLSVVIDDEKRSVTFQENATPIKEEPVFHDRCPSEDSDSLSFNIPIYCYDCPISALISIPDNKTDTDMASEEAKKREDIFQDFTEYAASIITDPFSLDEVPRSLEGRTKGRFGPSKDLLLHSNAVHDLFFRSFVSSTFASLQHGQQVSMRNVHAAVDACEENFLEVDITDFIRTLCGHYVKSNASKEALREAQISEGFQAVPICLPSVVSTKERVKDLKNILSGNCESVPGLHESIRAKFMAILGRYFKAVTPSSEYFFYCPQLSDGPRKQSVPESFSESETNDADQVAEDESQDLDKDSDIASDTFDDVDPGILIEDDGSMPQFNDMDDDLSDFESEGSSSEFEGDVNDGDQHSKSPLFLQLTCSLRGRSSHGQPMTPVSINTLPVCLGEIIKKLEDDEEFLDPFSSSVRITLDLICLTLPPEPDYSVLKSSARSAPSRSNSYSSTSSPVSLSPQDRRSGLFEFRRQDSKATSHDIDGIDSLDPLHGLVHSQRHAMNSTCDAIRWLLQDEIVSELRHISPVTWSMLEKVENHVKQSEDHPSCISRHVRLQFVYGAEQSLELFVKEFERINLPEYLLNNVEKYYYLTSFIEKQIAYTSPMTVEVVSSVPTKEGQKSFDVEDDECSSITQISGPTSLEESRPVEQEAVVNAETGEEESQELEPRASNDGLLAVFSDKQSATAREEESDVSDTSMGPPAVTVSVEENPTEIQEGEFTPTSKHPHLGDVGKQEPLQEEPDTPVKDTSFTSSASSTPVGKLIIPTADGSTAESSSAGMEDVDEETSTPGPCTPRQEEQSPRMADEYLQFWLVMRIFDNEVTIFFHRRESDDPKAFCATRATGLVELVTNAIHEKCRIVNQRMLLHDLYETKVCNTMLYPESDEDIWKHEELTMSVSPLGVHITKGDRKGRVTSKFVQVEFLFQPGHFGCNSVWHTHLPVPQRLMDTSGRTGISRGFKAIKSVLDRFGVSNRRDMFVYKDSTGAVFYFRLFESLCSSDSSNQFQSELRAPDDEDDECRSGLSSVASLAGSPSSSQWSLVKAGTGELDEDDIEAKLKKQHSALDRDRSDTISEGGRSLQAVQPVVDKSIALHVYGVDDPGPEITGELVEVLQNRLNEAMLEVLSVLLSRNPNCKLTYADVRFIQPQGQAPKTTLRLTIPPMDVNFLCPLAFYLRQNLLQLLHSPRYMDSNPSHHFKAVSGSKTDATGNNSGDSCRLEPEIYLYNRPASSGGRGLACISMSVLNSRGGYIYIPCGKTTCNDYVGELDNFEQFTEVFLCEDGYQLAEDDIMVQFAIWERGDIALDQLASHLKLALRHALCDLLAEYYLLTAPLSKVPLVYRKALMTRPRSCSEPSSPNTLTPKVPTLGSYPQASERSSRRQLDFGSQSEFRSRTASLGGQRRKVSTGSTISCGSTALPGRVHQNPFLSQRESVSSTHPVSRQSTMEDEVFKTEVVPAEDEDEDLKVEGDETPSKRKLKTTPELIKTGDKSEPSSDVEQTFESFTAAEIQESQEFTSQPGTPVSENMAFTPKTEGLPSEREKPSRKLSSVSTVSGSKDVSSVGQPSDEKATWQDIEARRRKEQERRIKRIQYENGEKGELHPSLQGLGQDMFAFFFDLDVPSTFRIDGKLINNFGSDAFLAELVNLISSVCPDLKPKIYREAPFNSTEDEDSVDPEEIKCLHYYPARQPLKVQDMDESRADKSGKTFVPLPDSSHFFVVVGRNVDQWRASLGREEDLSQEDPFGRPRIRPGLQRFKPLDPNAPVPGRIISDNTSISSLSVGGVPRQKFLLVTVLDKDVIVFTYNWAADLNISFGKQLHRLLNWSNARCHLTSCLVSQKMGLFHHTLFADINKGKEGKEMNPFCLSANDMDMTLLISRPGPPPLDRERALPRQMPPSPNILVFDEVLRDVTPPRPLYRAQYSHNRDLVKRHGYQFQDIRSVQIKQAILEQSLDELYVMWQRRPPHAQISEDKIETLKRSSRLIHYCAAPLLFHPDWRQKRSASALESAAASPHEPCAEQKEEETKGKDSKGQKKSEGESRKGTREEESVQQEGKSSSQEEAWHQELRSAYLQQYVQYMQSLQFIVIQTRPQSPKPSRRHPGRSVVNSKPKKESSAGDVKKQNSSKERKESPSQTLQCFLQRSSPGGIMLMELVFQGCFFIVRLYALGCSQIPSGKTVSVQMSRMFVEDCTRYREYIHLLSFNYDFHLWKAQLYLNGSQRIFNKGYRVTDMLKGLLLEYPQYPLFARNRLCEGDIAVPCHPGISPEAVFNYLVKNAAKYDFSTLPVETASSKKAHHVLLATERVLTQERTSETKAYDILRDNNEYDITFVVSLKDSSEEGIVNMEYVVLMTSRRDLFPKLTLDLRMRKKSPSSSSLSSMGVPRKGSFLDNGEVEQDKGSRVRFTLPSSSSSGSLAGLFNPPSPGEFHRSASSPHSLFTLGNDSGFHFPNVIQSHSDENIAEQRSGSNVSFTQALATYEGVSPENVSQRESRMLNEAFLRARGHLVHVVCRAQTNCNRDLLWHRLLAGGTGEEEKDGGKRGRRRSEVRRSGSDYSLKLTGMKGLDTLYPGADQSSPRLSFEEFKQLLSVVESKSLKNEDSQLIPLLSMRASWYLDLFRVIAAKFPDVHRVFSSEADTVHYLAILNADNPDMFVLLHIDEHNDTADILVVFREEPIPDESGTSRESRLLSKKIRSHVYSVVNAVCFHLWTSLLPA